MKMKKREIDLRSDTQTLPCEGMREAMLGAEVGDDVAREDPSVNELQEYGCEISGKEASIFVLTGTQANLIGALAHCDRGDEYIAGSLSHIYRWEAGGASVVGGLQVQPVEFSADGTLDLRLVKEQIKPGMPHYARTRLLCLENTQMGKALPMEYLRQAYEFCGKNGLGLYMDGARVFNAAVALGVDLKEIAGSTDTISLCMSKALGAPAGSLLCGSREVIERGIRLRKMLGCGARQLGMLAAGCMYALKHNMGCLAQDHLNAKYLANEIDRLNVPHLFCAELNTNMVFVNLPEGTMEGLRGYLKSRGILAGGYSSPRYLRLVLHKSVEQEDVRRVAEAMGDYYVEVAMGLGR